MKRKAIVLLVLAMLMACVTVLINNVTSASAAEPPTTPCHDISAPTFTGGSFVADPVSKTAPQISCTQAKWTWGWVTGTIYLSRAETSKLSFGASVSGIVGAFLSVSAVAAVFGTLAAYATYVYRQGHCIKFKLYPGPTLIQAVPQEYWGGYCA